MGNTISVAAFNITIIDADGFTRDFYESKQMTLYPAIPISPPVYPEISTYFLFFLFLLLFLIIFL